jgi:hypothetical protein
VGYLSGGDSAWEDGATIGAAITMGALHEISGARTAHVPLPYGASNYGNYVLAAM